MRIVCRAREECAAADQLAQQLRGAQAGSGDELAAGPHARQRLGDALFRKNFLPRIGIVLARAC